MKSFSSLFPEAVERLRSVQSQWDVERPCKGCKGKGLRSKYDAVKRDFIPLAEPCIYCDGEGKMHRPDLPSLIDAVSSVIKGKCRLRSTRPPRHPKNPFAMFENRAYYIWRIARFHGGVDVTMPVIASMDVNSDPYVDELEQVAQAVARIFLGNDLAGAARWGRLLGLPEVKTTQKLPPTAYESGPVVLGSKPEEEAIELQ